MGGPWEPVPASPAVVGWAGGLPLRSPDKEIALLVVTATNDTATAEVVLAGGVVVYQGLADGLGEVVAVAAAAVVLLQADRVLAPRLRLAHRHGLVASNAARMAWTRGRNSGRRDGRS
jgi:hypothetical protein